MNLEDTGLYPQATPQISWDVYSCDHNENVGYHNNDTSMIRAVVTNISAQSVQL